MPDLCDTHSFVQPANAETASLRLFCMPYAGGGTWIFRQWPRLLGDDVAVYPVKLPGRADRFREEAATDLHALADDLAQELAFEDERPCAFFGYSMGALLAFETAIRLVSRKACMPASLIVAAAPAPHLIHVDDPVHGLEDKELVRVVQERYRNPLMVELDEEMLPLILPALRGDMTMYETYRSRQPPPPLDCPAHVLGGTEDAIPLEKLNAWEAYTTAATTTKMFPGGHFFIHEHEDAVVEYVSQQLRP